MPLAHFFRIRTRFIEAEGAGLGIIAALLAAIAFGASVYLTGLTTERACAAVAESWSGGAVHLGGSLDEPLRTEGKSPAAQMSG
jgi:hypothetical protein